VSLTRQQGGKGHLPAKGVPVEVLSFDRLSQKSSEPDGGVQVLQNAEDICSQKVLAHGADNKRAVGLPDVISN